MGGSQHKSRLKEQTETEYTTVNTPDSHGQLIEQQEHTFIADGSSLVSNGSSSNAGVAGQPSSLMGKITESAGGLSKGFMTRSAAYGVSSASASEQSSSSKWPLFTDSSESSSWAQHSEPSRSSQKSRLHALEPEQAFRSTYDKGSGEQEFSQHLSLTRSPSFGLGEPLQLARSEGGDLPAVGDGKSPVQTSKGAKSPHQSGRPSYSSHTSSGGQHVDPNDGAEVVALLSDPVLGTEDLPPSSFSIAIDQFDTNDQLRSRTSKLVSEAEDVLRAKLPAAPKHNAPSPSNPLNLIPDQAWFDSEILGSLANFDTGKENHNMGFELDAASTEYYSGWEGVLSRYTDEVWGDLLPIVKEARADIGQVLDGRQSLEPKAARRLEMILGHLRTGALP